MKPKANNKNKVRIKQFYKALRRKNGIICIIIRILFKLCQV